MLDPMRHLLRIVAALLPVLCAAADIDAFRVSTNLVLVNVTVLDSNDRPVTGLTRDRFHVAADGREQPIRFFAHENAPLSLGVVLDTSGSMRPNWRQAREMLALFCENLEPADELFLVTLDRAPHLAADYSRDCSGIRDNLLTVQPRGLTALLDAIPLAAGHLKQARNSRHALLLISDGGENASRARYAEIRNLAREAGAQIYTATLNLDSLFDHAGYYDGLRGPSLLHDLATISGGRSFAIDQSRHIAATAAAMAREMHDQYLLGFQSPDPAEDGKFHRLAVTVQRDPDAPRLTLFYRRGYRNPWGIL